jgi:hypothetical protein
MDEKRIGNEGQQEYHTNAQTKLCINWVQRLAVVEKINLFD